MAINYYHSDADFSLEFDRTEVSARTFYTYVSKKIKKYTGYALDWYFYNYDQWAAGDDLEFDTHHDGIHELSVSRPFEAQSFIHYDNGDVYNIILEWDDGHGYFYFMNKCSDSAPAETPAPEKEITFTPDSVTVDNGHGNVSTVDRRSVPTRVKDFEKCFYVSHGNIKLKSNDETLFIIWSLPARITCPYRTEHCSEKCYAVKAETARPDVLPSRMRNFEFSKRPEFVPYMIRLLELKMQHSRGRKIVVRVHESGDFYNIFYARKWLEIARHFVGENIVFMAYTKSLPFFRNEDVPENFVIRASLWDDTTPELREESALYPVYTALSRAEMDALPQDSFHECRCSDCATCGKCWDKNVRNIICEIH